MTINLQLPVRHITYKLHHGFQKHLPESRFHYKLQRVKSVYFIVPEISLSGKALETQGFILLSFVAPMNHLTACGDVSHCFISTRCGILALRSPYLDSLAGLGDGSLHYGMATQESM